MTPPTRMLNIGLRFAQTDAQLLDFLADRVEAGEVPGDSMTFRSAADAARTGEPLIVKCRSPDEAIVMAQMYATLGCDRPVLDALPDWARGR